MHYYAGIDVFLEACSVCLVDPAGKIIRETKAWQKIGGDARSVAHRIPGP